MVKLHDRSRRSSLRSEKKSMMNPPLLRTYALASALRLIPFAWPGAADPVVAAEPTVRAQDLPRVAPTPPEKAIATFKVKPGFRIEQVAAEPLVVDPVAMAFDENGR